MSVINKKMYFKWPLVKHGPPFLGKHLTNFSWLCSFFVAKSTMVPEFIFWWTFYFSLKFRQTAHNSLNTPNEDHSQSNKPRLVGKQKKVRKLTKFWTFSIFSRWKILIGKEGPFATFLWFVPRLFRNDLRYNFFV